MLDYKQKNFKGSEVALEFLSDDIGCTINDVKFSIIKGIPLDTIRVNEERKFILKNFYAESLGLHCLELNYSIEVRVKNTGKEFLFSSINYIYEEPKFEVEEINDIEAEFLRYAS